MDIESLGAECLFEKREVSLTTIILSLVVLFGIRFIAMGITFNVLVQCLVFYILFVCPLELTASRLFV